MAESVHQYIKYHSEPCSGFVTIKEWNKHFNTDVEENEELEYKIMTLRSQLGHNEFIPTSSLLKYIRKSARKSLESAIDNKTSIYKRDYMRHAANKLTGALHLNRIRKITNKLRGKKKEKEEPSEVEQEDVQEEKEEENEEVQDLDDLLQADSEYEEVRTNPTETDGTSNKVYKKSEGSIKNFQEEYEEEDMDDILAEQEYEEEDCHQKCPPGHKEVKHFNHGPRGCKPETVSTPVAQTGQSTNAADDDAATFQQAVDELEISDAQALNHLVAFKGDHSDIRSRLMKGKSRYIQKLQAYVNGDENAEIRMYNGTKMKIANLNPNRESLSKALQAFPSGPHIIECD